jgi:DNA-binding MarR family transcriptional regulator
MSTIEKLELSGNRKYTVSGMGGKREGAKKAIAVDVWRMMAEFSMASFQRSLHVEILKELGLTPGHMKVLSVLEPHDPRPMGVIADACHCDPSMATWLVDRLEERGLVQRGSLATDRRVKTVTLTPEGVATKQRLLTELYEPPAELVALDRATLQTLRGALEKLPKASAGLWGRRREVEAPPKRRQPVAT